MMKRTFRRCAALLGLMLLGAASGGELSGAGTGDVEACSSAGCAPSAAATCKSCSSAGCRTACPDDYRAKSIPCFCLPPTRGGCDDYCPKPAPCFCLPPTCGGCDDYCPKPAPCVSRPCGWPEFYKCALPLPCFLPGMAPAKGNPSCK